MNIILFLNFIFAENLTLYRNVKSCTLTDFAYCGIKNAKTLNTPQKADLWDRKITLHVAATRHHQMSYILARNILKEHKAK
jgi:hypothetical protein